MRLLSFLFALFVAAPVLAEERAPHVAAEGVAEVHAAPDRATVRFGVQEQATDAKKAQDAVNARMQKVIAAVKGRGVASERIGTERIELMPVYDHREPRDGSEWKGPRLVGYRAANVVRVELPLEKGRADEVGRVIDAAIGAGANTLEGITFDLRDDEAARDRALREAAKQARRRAESIAASLGVQLGTLLEARDAAVVDVPPPTRMYAMEAKAFASTPVQPGELTVRATVIVRYAVK